MRMRIIMIRAYVMSFDMFVMHVTPVSFRNIIHTAHKPAIHLLPCH